MAETDQCTPLMWSCIILISRAAKGTLLKYKLTTPLAMFKGQRKEEETGEIARQVSGKQESFVP